MTPRPVLSSVPCDPADIPRLRVGRRVPEHVYVMIGDEPDEDDAPLWTAPDSWTAELVVDAMEALRWLNLNPGETDVD